MGDNLGLGRVVPQRHQHQAGNAHGQQFARIAEAITAAALAEQLSGQQL
jgi:hypothetical protein